MPEKFYATVVRCCDAPKGGGGKYRRPVRVLVVDATGGIKGKYRRDDACILREWRNLDRRYSGHRSAYGQVIRVAEKMVSDLNLNSKGEVV